MSRIGVLVLAVCFAGWFVSTVRSGTEIPFKLVTAGVWLAIGAVGTIRGRRYKYVWLDGDVLEVRGGGIRRIPLADLAGVRLFVYPPVSFILLRFKSSAEPVWFIPTDYSYLAGAGKGTRDLLWSHMQ